MTGRITLYDYWRSSSAYRVRIALNLLGVQYDRVSVDLAAGAQTQAGFLAVNPQGLVPVLDIDGLRLTQSLAILDYLNDTRVAGFLPADAAGRVRVRALALAIAADIQPVCNLRVARHAVSLGGAATMQGWMAHFIAQGFTGLEAMLSADPAPPLCCGDSVTMADICLVPQVYNARRWEVEMARFPRIAAIAARLEAMPAIAAAHPDRVRAMDGSARTPGDKGGPQ